MGYAIGSVVMASFGGFFLGTAYMLHPLNKEMRAAGVLLGFLCLVTAAVGLLGAANG